MSDESKLPERVWISPGSYRAGKLWSATHADSPLLRPYIREDVAKAMVAAALLEIREMALEGCAAPNAAYRWCERIDELTFSLMNDDARAALERVREDARKEEREACAEIADQAHEWTDHTGDVAKAIRARGGTT